MVNDGSNTQQHANSDGQLSADPAAYSPKAVRTLLIDNYDSYTFNLFQLLAEVNGGEPQGGLFVLASLTAGSNKRHLARTECPLVRKNDDVTLSEVRQLIASGQVHNVVISPGPGNPHAPQDVGG
jgi:para-aminobenzoate synthetase